LDAGMPILYFFAEDNSFAVDENGA
jgi:hypothetical protein